MTRPDTTRSDTPTVRLLSTEQIDSFSHRWPDDVEVFNQGWECRVTVEGTSLKVRHGIGQRNAYGRERIHSVTFVNGLPTVEGVEADDYGDSHALLSLLRRPDGHLVRLAKEIPPGYGELRVVHHEHEIRAPYSRRSLAVKLRADDLEAWVTHAVLRAVMKGHLPSPDRTAVPQSRTRPTSEALARMSAREVGRVADALASYGRELTAQGSGRVPQFTPDTEANRLVVENPFAFLLGVIFDQGVVAEKAWRAPYELRRRLGHLDPQRFSAERKAVEEAVRGPPALHRYVGKLPRWIVSAAKRVVQHYAGDAERLWNDGPTARELETRLRKFEGIAQKKAAMAVNILARDLRKPIRDLEGTDIAYDVHVRRVFLRTGLAERDDPAHMISVARGLHPEQPGIFDLAAWDIGRTWCHAQAPDCPKCVLTSVCPKEIDRAATVTGA